MVQSVAFACRLFRSIAAAKPRRSLFVLFALAMMSIATSATALTTFTINDGTNDTDRNNAAATCVCQDTQGSPKCTLRAAIETLNGCQASSGPFSITFAVPTVHVINGGLPTITAPVTITGPAAIDGQNGQFKEGCLAFSDAASAQFPDGATNSQVTLLSISNCSGDAISANGHGFLFSGNTLHDNVGAGISL